MNAVSFCSRVAPAAIELVNVGYRELISEPDEGVSEQPPFATALGRSRDTLTKLLL